MLSLQNYLIEGLITEVVGKNNLPAIKNWAKTIKKSSGRIKVDSNGCITLPNSDEIKLVGPFPENVSFSEFECSRILLDHVTQSEIEMITKVAQGVYSLYVDIVEDVDFSDMDLKLKGFGAFSTSQNTISGLKNIEIEGSRVFTFFEMEGVKCDGSFKSGKDVFIELTNVTTKPDLLKNFTSVRGINISNSSPIDLHKIDVEANCNLRGLDEKFEIGYLPRSANNLWIESSVPFEEFDIHKVKTKAEKFHYNSIPFDPAMNDDDQQIIQVTQQIIDRKTPIPSELFDCLKHLSSKVVSQKNIANEHLCVVVETNGKDDREKQHISLFENGKWVRSLVYQPFYGGRWVVHAPYTGGRRDGTNELPEIISDEYYVILPEHEKIIYKVFKM